MKMSPDHAVTVIKNPIKSLGVSARFDLDRVLEQEKHSNSDDEEEEEAEKAVSEDSEFLEKYVEQ